jgi:hypothetical protein
MKGHRLTPPQQTCDGCELDAFLTRFRGRWLCDRCLLGAEPSLNQERGVVAYEKRLRAIRER